VAVCRERIASDQAQNGQKRRSNRGKFKDTYRENVERLIEEKRKRQKITTVQQPRKAPGIDLMEALKRSLQYSGAAASGKKGSSRTRAKKPSNRHKAA
jgi:non-homologous end joining protein Ku